MSDNTRSKDIAEAILMVIKRILLWITVAVGVGIAVIGLYLWYSKVSNERAQRTAASEEVKRRQELANLVAIEVRVGEAPCAGDKPFKLMVTNNSRMILRNLSYKMEVTYTGRSSILNDRDTTLYSDIIASPGQSYWVCESVLERYSYSSRLELKPNRPGFEATIWVVDADFS